jgi:hypothetical protein
MYTGPLAEFRLLGAFDHIHMTYCIDLLDITVPL